MELIIAPANASEKVWAAGILAGSDPWVRLGVKLETLLKTCHDPEYQIFAARVGETPCGIMILDPRGVAGSPYIKSIAVAPGFRDSGIGAKMVIFAETLFSSQSKHMFLCVSSFNDRARKFYMGLGYMQVGEFADYIIEGESEILMHKRIG